MALTTPFETYEKPGLVASYKLDAVKILRGSMVGINASGYAERMDHNIAGLRFVGVANETVDNSAGAAGDRAANVTKSGSFVMKASFTPTVADIAKEVNLTSDWEVQLGVSGLTNVYAVGTITALESTSTGALGVRIRIDTHVA